jgi:hypothetical protein
VAFFTYEFHRRFLFSVIHTLMSDSLATHVNRIVWGISSSSENILIILEAITVDIMIAEMLSTEGTDKIKLLQLSTIPIYKPGPLIHFITSLFVKFILKVVVLLFQLLWELVNDIILEL